MAKMMSALIGNCSKEHCLLLEPYQNGMHFFTTINVAIRNERDVGKNETSERLNPFMIKVTR